MSTNIDRISNGILEEIDELLDDTNKIPTQTVFRLNLAVQKEMALALNRLINHVNTQNDRISTTEKDIIELKENSIIRWAKSNLKLSILYLFLFVLVTDIAVELISSVDSYNLLVAMLKKWLGI